jgi:predicted transcriptional regulator
MASRPRWSLLTNHARVLLCIADDPGIRLREIGALVGITERTAHSIIVELEESGYVARRRDGRRNHYTVKSDVPLPDGLARKRRVRDLLEVLLSSEPQDAATRSG